MVPHRQIGASGRFRLGCARFCLGVVMRVSAAILAVMLGSSAVLAQSDPRANPAPVQPAKPEAKSEPKAKPAAKKPESKPEAKSETAAEAKPEPKAKGRHKEAKAKPAKDTKEQDHQRQRPDERAAEAVRPAGHLCGDPGRRPRRDPERPDLGRRLHRTDRRRVQRAAGGGGEGLPDPPQEPGHRRA